MQYQAIPFIAKIQKGQGAEAAAQQLQQLINEQASFGWRYLRLENIVIIVHDPGSKGCFGIFGVIPPSQQTLRYDMAVFEKN